MSDTVKATVYLQVQPEFSRLVHLRDTPASVRDAKIVGYTQNRAKKPRSGVVEVKIAIEIPKAAFLPLRPEAVVVIPETMTTPHPIEVVAEDPNKDGE